MTGCTLSESGAGDSLGVRKTTAAREQSARGCSGCFRTNGGRHTWATTTTTTTIINAPVCGAPVDPETKAS
eukprot:11679786-Heterocapsa_arctica.AAC.1